MTIAFYHHSRINQSLHFVSAASFLFAYVMLFVDPAVSGAGRLAGLDDFAPGRSLFFEPKGYDHVNQATHEHKEEIKLGYNLQRKVVLMTIWRCHPAVLYIDPTLFGLFTPWASAADFMRQLPRSGSWSAPAGCCSAPSTCSSSATSRPAWSG